MAKILLIVALIAALALSCISAATVTINVGAGGKNAFDPAIANVMTGDTVMFMWVGTGKHSVVQSDAAKSCTASTTLTALSAKAATAPNSFNYTVTEAAGAKMWYFCSVATHCSADNMYGTLVVGGASSAAPSGSPSAAAPSGSPSATTSDSFKINSNVIVAASMAIIGVIGLLL